MQCSPFFDSCSPQGCAKRIMQQWSAMSLVLLFTCQSQNLTSTCNKQQKGQQYMTAESSGCTTQVTVWCMKHNVLEMLACWALQTPGTSIERPRKPQAGAWMTSSFASLSDFADQKVNDCRFTVFSLLQCFQTQPGIKPITPHYMQLQTVTHSSGTYSAYLSESVHDDRPPNLSAV